MLFRCILVWTFITILYLPLAQSFQHFGDQQKNLGDPTVLKVDFLGKVFRSGGGKRRKIPRNDKKSVSDHKMKKEEQKKGKVHPIENSIVLDPKHWDDCFDGVVAPTISPKNPIEPVEPISPAYSKPFNPIAPIAAPEVLDIDSPIVGYSQPQIFDTFSTSAPPNHSQLPTQPGSPLNFAPIGTLKSTSFPTKSSSKPFPIGSSTHSSTVSKAKSTKFPSSFPPPPSPMISINCPKIPEGGCSICGSGQCVSNPNGIFFDPGQPALSCGNLEAAALEGTISPGRCEYLSTVVDKACRCKTHKDISDDVYTVSAVTRTNSPFSLFLFSTPAPSTLNFKSFFLTEQPSYVSSTDSFVDCASIANGTAPTEAAFVSLLVMMNLVSSQSINIVDTLLQPLLQRRVAPLVVGCYLRDRGAQESFGQPPINVVFKHTQQIAKGESVYSMLH
jgi:hypothetical protein